MKMFEISGNSKTLDGTISGAMLWNWREGKWVDFDGDDGNGTSMTAESVSIKPISDDELRAFAEAELERAKADCGYLEDITLREDEYEYD